MTITKYVALLRGIGPGNPNMKGDKLKAFFEELGFKNVQTLLASGNVLFESSNTDTKNMAKNIEEALPKKLGFSSTAIIRSQAQLQKLIDRDPYKGQQHDNRGTYLLVTFFKQTPQIKLRLPHTPDGKPYTLLGKIDDAVYGSVDLTAGKTPDYMTWLERQFGKDLTSRTLKTIQRILAKMDQA
jgi:uncharacterized protein (DUF1697 family)